MEKRHFYIFYDIENLTKHENLNKKLKIINLEFKPHLEHLFTCIIEQKVRLMMTKLKFIDFFVVVKFQVPNCHNLPDLKKYFGIP